MRGVLDNMPFYLKKWFLSESRCEFAHKNPRSVLQRNLVLELFTVHPRDPRFLDET